MKTHIQMKCSYCGSTVDSTLEWLEENQLIFCNSCCKSFEPVQYRIIEQKKKAAKEVDSYLHGVDFYPRDNKIDESDYMYALGSMDEEEDSE